MEPCKASVFIATSLDGFIARPDGELDWLPAANASNDMNYSEFIANVDVLVMGRHTFEKVVSFGEWPYDVPVRVLSRRGVEVPAAWRDSVNVISGEPLELLLELSRQGFKHAYVDGGETIQAFIAADLIQRLIITLVPVLIGSGLRLFGPLSDACTSMMWRHVKTVTWSNGLVQSQYHRD